MSKSPKTLAKKLAAFIDGKEMSKMGLHKRTGLTRDSINDYLSETTVPRLDQVDRLAEAMGVEPWQLIQPGNLTPRQMRIISLVSAMEDHQLDGILKILEAWPRPQKKAERA